MAAKLYDSKEWLRRQHHINRKPIDLIAKECGVSSMTIRRKLEGFGLRVIK